MYDYSNMSNMEVLEAKRNSEKDALINDNSVFLVDRLNVVTDMFSICQDTQIAKSLIKINFRGKDVQVMELPETCTPNFIKRSFVFILLVFIQMFHHHCQRQ